MTECKKDGSPFPTDMTFEEAVARLIQTDPKEIADARKRVRAAQEDTKKYVEERKESIRRGARRAKSRFSL